MASMVDMLFNLGLPEQFTEIILELISKFSQEFSHWS